MLAIRNLADKVAQHLFANLGSFVLDRTVQSFISADGRRLHGPWAIPAVKKFARRDKSAGGKAAKLTDLEHRLSSVQ
jgi:hypothetical protein